MPNTAPHYREISLGEVRNIAVDWSDSLDVDGTPETLSGTPTVAEVTTSHLSISNVQVSASQLTINNRKVAAGKAVQFKVDPGPSAVAGATYSVDITCATSAGQTLVGRVQLKVIA